MMHDITAFEPHNRCVYVRDGRSRGHASRRRPSPASPSAVQLGERERFLEANKKCVTLRLQLVELAGLAKISGM